MKHATHKSLETAYAFYYATDVVPESSHSTRDSPEDKTRLGVRLNALMKDSLIVAKQVCYRVTSREGS